MRESSSLCNGRMQNTFHLRMDLIRFRSEEHTSELQSH